MGKNFRKFAVIIIFFAVLLSIAFGFAKDEDKKGAVTQGELAKVLIERMDLDVPKEAPMQDRFNTLEGRGIKPTEGWNQEKPLTKQDLEKVLVETGRLQAEVLSGKNPQSVLKDRGIILPDDINRKTIDGIFKDQNVNRLFEMPAISGPSVPFPRGGLKIVKSQPKLVGVPLEVPTEAEETEQPKTEPLPIEPPPPPPPPEPPRPSGGGAQ